MMSSPSSSRSRACSMRVLKPPLGERILAAQVDVAALAAGRVGGDRHRLDHRERIALQDHPILERARLGLVGVADQVVRPARLAGDRLPLAPGRERGAAAPHQLGVEDLADHAVGAELERAPQRRVAAVRAVVVEALGIDHADPAEQAQPRLAGLRRHRRARWRRRRPAHHLEQAFGRRPWSARARAAPDRTRPAAPPAPGRTAPGTGSAASVAAVRARLPAGRRARSARRSARREPAQPAGDVVADVQHARRPRLEREQRVEGRDAVHVGRRDRQPPRDVVERRRG